MQNTKEQGTPAKKIWDSVLDLLGVVAFPLFIILACWGDSLLHLTPGARSLMVLAMLIALTVQLSRGLLGFLNVPNIPTWLPICKLNSDRLLAECLLMMLVLWLLASISIHGDADFKPFYGPICIIDLSLGLALAALGIKRMWSGGDIASLKFAAIFLAPMTMAAGLAFGMYQMLHLRGYLDVALLAISALIPLIVAAIRRSIKDERDWLKNIYGVIWTQVAALPLVPVSFFLLKLCWPKQIDGTVLMIGLLVLPVVLGLLPKRNKKKPWMIKEKLQILRWQIHKQKDGQPGTLTPELEQELLQVRQELAALNLVSNDFRDHVDKADTYRELGHVECGLHNYQEAEKNFVNAVETYDDALRLAPNDTVAKSNRAGVIVKLGALRNKT
ncbi:MAG: hypothetical protein IAF58_14700 [Leptolyngbya sp.]|nr:hypothetical protein [Candidatus Melainabacteria bacterium]